MSQQHAPTLGGPGGTSATPRAVLDPDASQEAGPGEPVVARRPAAPPTVLHPVPGSVVVLAGRVDALCVADVRAALREALDCGTGELEVDVAGLVLGDATGLGALLAAHRRATRCGRSLVLVDVPPSVARLLALTRLSRVLTVRAGAAGQVPAAG